ncbi:unnamed protein product [Onchocerca ochengi]|uniref:AMP-binding_C domain-containing protein n=1 Tax=Onchocerca ochengi TaxID=42157 RepID=A0A182EUM3_ONCOC|nr:unnamed protein product [Onchocerca ochengi]
MASKYRVSLDTFHREGRAGMAAIVLAGDEFLEDVIHKITEHLKKSLPSYAIPVFLRFCKNFERTGPIMLNFTSDISSFLDENG